MIALFLAACTQPQLPETAPTDACAAGALPQDEMVVRMTVDDLSRSALVWAPPGAGPHDVIVSLHEFGSEPRRQAWYSGMVDAARARNAILIGADGKTATWNAGDCCGKSRDRGVDDVKFLDALVARVDAVGCTSGRVLATGIGAGAMMAETWACQSAIPDAVLSVGGVLQLDDCKQTRPIPLVHYWGSLDRWMPANGSDHHHPVTEAMGLWAKRNHAVPAAKIAGGALSCDHWEGDAPVTSCVVDGMLDKWPGAEDAKGFLGPDGKEISATVDGLAMIAPYWKP